jgi:hypothetical protein
MKNMFGFLRDFNYVTKNIVLSTTFGLIFSPAEQFDFLQRKDTLQYFFPFLVYKWLETDMSHFYHIVWPGRLSF